MPLVLRSFIRFLCTRSFSVAATVPNRLVCGSGQDGKVGICVCVVFTCKLLRSIDTRQHHQTAAAIQHEGYLVTLVVSLFGSFFVCEFDHHIPGVHVDDREGPHRGPRAVRQLASNQNNHVFQLGQLLLLADKWFQMEQQ